MVSPDTTYGRRGEIVSVKAAPESIVWQSAHYEEPFHRRRIAKLPAKLSRLGVLGLDREAHILDTCCGAGDALQALHDRGYRNLTGVDVLSSDAWGALP